MHRWPLNPMYDPRTDLYQLLGVSDAADADTIRQAHRKHIQAVHPDHNGSIEATRRSATLNAARDLLLDPAKRKQYDAARLLWQFQQTWIPQPSARPVPPIAVPPAGHSPVTPAASTSPPMVAPAPMTGFGQVDGFEQRVERYFTTPPASPTQAVLRGMLLGLDILATAHRAGRGT